VLENASDLLMDIPKLWFYLGEIVGPIVQIIGLSFLTRAVEPLQSMQINRGAFVGAILSYAAQNMVSSVSIFITYSLLRVYTGESSQDSYYVFVVETLHR